MNPSAQTVYESAVDIEPGIACHYRLPGALLPFVRMDRVEELLLRALDLDPSFAPAQAALGNVFIRRVSIQAAIRAYSAAVMLDWDFADAHLALAGLFEMMRDEANADRHYREALMRKRLYVSQAQSAVRRILVLKAPGRAVDNTPLDFAVNHAQTALHVLYVAPEGITVTQLPEYDIVYGGMGESESAAACVETSIHFMAGQAKPVVNNPKHFAKIRRAALHETLADVAGCTAPPAIRVDRSELQSLLHAPQAVGMDFPLLIRPTDTHRGDGLERLRSARELKSYLERFGGSHFSVCPFVDYRSPDGFYRKYRVVVVDGRPFAYHLAISGEWMVHYVDSLMDAHAWMRAEEERFFEDPRAVFPAWHETFAGMAKAVGLEYFGVDCARSADGGVLVFEAGPNTLVHCRDSEDVFSYKCRHVPRIFDALERLFDRAASQAR